MTMGAKKYRSMKSDRNVPYNDMNGWKIGLFMVEIYKYCEDIILWR